MYLSDVEIISSGEMTINFEWDNTTIATVLYTYRMIELLKPL